MCRGKGAAAQMEQTKISLRGPPRKVLWSTAEGQGVMHRRKTPVSPGQVVLYKETVSVSGIGCNESLGCCVYLVSILLNVLNNYLCSGQQSSL